MNHRLLWAVSTACLVSTIPVQADTLSRGQEVAAAFLRGDAAAIWSAMTPEMQAALGSAETLTTTRASLENAFGKEEQVLSERTVQQGAHEVYTRLSRWTGSPQPLQLLVSFDRDGRIAGLLVRPQPVAAPSPHLDYQTRATLRLPFEGAWYVYWGGRDIEENYHAVDAGQRFAMDFLVLKDGNTHEGDPAVLENYYCWDQPVLAPADGVVAAAVDGLPDQWIGSTDTRNPVGNHVVLDFGNGEYGFLAHLRQGSVSVAAGDRVKAGTEVGRCGNSGNTSEPHLHFHLQTSPRFGEGEGLPAQFQNYRADGNPVARGEPRRGQTIQPAG